MRHYPHATTKLSPRAQTKCSAEKENAVFKHYPSAQQPKSSFEVADYPPPPNFKYPRYTPHPHRRDALSREAATRASRRGSARAEPSVSSFGSFLSDDRKELPRSRPQAAFSRRPQTAKPPPRQRRGINQPRPPVGRQPFPAVRRRRPGNAENKKEALSRTAHR